MNRSELRAWLGDSSCRLFLFEHHSVHISPIGHVDLWYQGGWCVPFSSDVPDSIIIESIKAAIGKAMNIDHLSSMLKECPDKSITIQWDDKSGRFVIAVDSDGEHQEVTRSRELITALQVACEGFVKKGG